METGLLFEGIYHCARGGGALRALYPRALTPAECQTLLTTLERTVTGSPLAAGMPAGTRVAHQGGRLGATYADAAVVYGPRADFVLVAFLYRPDWVAWEDAIPTFASIGQLTYRFFNGDTALAQP